MRRKSKGERQAKAKVIIWQKGSGQSNVRNDNRKTKEKSERESETEKDKLANTNIRTEIMNESFSNAQK